ncbi:unnamed protein product [Cochlearia groenlandica]
MVRTPCCKAELGLKKGAWTPKEDQKLVSYVSLHGEGGWRTLPERAGLKRCGKSCRLRWANYLRPNIKRGDFKEDEERSIISLHALHGNKWAAIARELPGRTDNEIKNYWNTRIKKHLIKKGIDPVTHKGLIISDTEKPKNLLEKQKSYNDDDDIDKDKAKYSNKKSPSAKFLNRVANKTGRKIWFDGDGMKKGEWTVEEDRKLVAYINQYGICEWRFLPQRAGLLRCGKSCRLRWLNYLRPGIKKGKFTRKEEEDIIKHHANLGNRWAAIAKEMDNRTDNDIKNHWNSCLKKRLLRNGIDPMTHEPIIFNNLTNKACSTPSSSSSSSSSSSPSSSARVLNKLATCISSSRQQSLDRIKSILSVQINTRSEQEEEDKMMNENISRGNEEGDFQMWDDEEFMRCMGYETTLYESVFYDDHLF